MSRGVGCHVDSGFAGSIVPGVDLHGEPWDICSPCLFPGSVRIICICPGRIGERGNGPVGNGKTISWILTRAIDDGVVEGHGPGIR